MSVKNSSKTELQNVSVLYCFTIMHHTALVCHNIPTRNAFDQNLTKCETFQALYGKLVNFCICLCNFNVKWSRKKQGMDGVRDSCAETWFWSDLTEEPEYLQTEREGKQERPLEHCPVEGQTSERKRESKDTQAWEGKLNWNPSQTTSGKEVLDLIRRKRHTT